ncbi:MAG: hypothetical protein ACXV3A_09650 [Kineosporiaceae bacterium]
MSLRLIDSAARRLRVASLVAAAAMIGAGSAAAVTIANVADSSPAPVTAADTPTGEPTAPGTGEPTPTTTGSPTPTSTGDPTPTTTGEPTPTTTGQPTETVPPLDPAACASARNHGEYVSHIAHLTKGQPDHGTLVSAAAHSNCGTTGDDADESDEATPTPSTTPSPSATSDDRDDDATAGATKVKSHKSHKGGKAHGKSHKHGTSNHR